MNAVVAEAKAKREVMGLSVRQLAVTIGVAWSTLARLERDGADPSIYVGARLVKWVQTGEGSPPGTRSQRSVNDLQKRVELVEQRLDALVSKA